MARDVSGGLESLKLTNDELGKLKKAFGDPEFRRLFKEYAEEITDPENRKRYEEEIRTMEQEQGMDVEFINPAPGYCLKSRHWPSLLNIDGVEKASSPGCSLENTKVFINVCKSDKVGCPIMKPIKNSSGKAVSNGFYWSLPHCFTPPHEDFDKNKQKVMVYDVAFHPKAFELANTSASMRRLLNVTAVEGVQRQFNLCLGKTAQQASHLSQLIRSASEPFSRPIDPNSREEPQPSLDSSRNRAETVAREEAILRVVHTLKGTAYKGMARPAVIRRRRADYEQCQADLKRKTDEELKNCTDPAQRETLTKLSRLAQRSSADPPHSGPSKPSYTITYSSDFDLINCRDAPDVDPMRPPDRIRVSVKLPGLVSSSAVDLDLTSTRLSLSSEKPVAYQLELNLPYEVDDSKASAKFDKSSSTLTVTAPLKQRQDSSDPRIVESVPHPLVAPVPVETTSTSDDSRPSPGCSSVSREPQTRKKRRKKNRRRHPSTGDSVSDCDTVSSAPQPTSDPKSVDSVDINEHVETEPSQCEDSSDPILPSDTAGESPEVLPEETSVGLATSIPITHVGLQQLIVNKDRRLAPIRFRQDPSSVSILFSVRGILPESFVLHWASPPLSMSTVTDAGEDAESALDSVMPEETLLLLFSFSSRGSGGCTMDWGVVVRCPSAQVNDSQSDLCREKFHPNSVSAHSPSSSVGSDLSNDSTSTLQCVHSEPPNIISVAFNPTNAVVVLAKPLIQSTDCTVKNTNKKGTTCWWTSVATGRTLIAGMQECPFEGVEGCLSRPHSRPCTPLKSPESHTEANLALNQINVCTLSTDCCEITWSRLDSAVSLKNVPLPTEMNKTNGIDASCTNLRPKVKESNNMAPPLLKGILKQRSYSESSGDEQLTPSSGLRFAGLADTRADMCLSSDEFPTASSDDADGFFASSSAYAGTPSTFHDLRRRPCQLVQGMRRCVSNEKLVSFSSLPNETNLSANGRRRRRSVNFSAHDQHVDYSPRDTVEALHHTLASRRKKARRRETRRRNYSGDSYTTSSIGEPDRKPCTKRNYTGRPGQHYSGNNSFGEDPFRKVTGENNAEESQTFDNAGDRPQTFGSPNSGSVPVAPSNSLSEASTSCLDATAEQNTATETAPTNMTICSTDPISNSSKRTTSAVTLCATPLFELDEE